jgi:Uma2 family endonuclease
MLTTIDQREQRVLLRNISWQLYESLSQEIGDDGQARLSYLQGDLEFMTLQVDQYVEVARSPTFPSQP